MAKMSEAKTLIPNWTQEDFDGAGPYEWLYEQRSKVSDFLFTKMLEKAQALAKACGIGPKLFQQYWKAYLADKSPKQSIGVNTADLPDGAGTLQSGMYRCNELGVRYTAPLGNEVKVISHPLVPVKRIVNVDSNDERIQLAYKRGKETAWRSVIVKNDVISSSQKIVALSSVGVSVNSENSKEVVKYLCELIDMNYDELPQQKSTSHLGWLPDGQFMPYADGIEYDGESSTYQQLFSAFRECGSFDEWLRLARSVRAGKSVPARIALAASFAGPLVSKLNGLPFLVHFHGKSSMGKSVALMLAASVWAQPDVEGPFIYSFNSTKNAHEGRAAFCCNVPICIDELQVVSDRKSFDDMIYMLCEGSSKPRLTRDGNLQTIKKWCTCILTTGEFTILKANSGGGAVGRTIEVDYGGEPLFENAREVASILKENYGFAGKIFVEALRNDVIMESARIAQDNAYRQMIGGDTQPKQVLSASILLAADRVAESVLFHDGNSLTVNEIRDYLTSAQEADSGWRCYQYMNDIVAANPKRFQDDADNNGPIWGVVKGNVAYFIRSEFERLVSEGGYSGTTFTNWLMQNNKIVMEKYGKNSGNNRRTKRVQIGKQSAACIAMVMDSEQVPNGFVEVSKEDELQF